MSVNKEVIHRRYIADEQGFEKLTKKLSNLLDLLSNDDAEQSLYSIINELSILRFELKKAEQIVHTNSKQCDSYDKTSSDKKYIINDLKKQIETLRIQLNQEKKIRQQKEEYEALIRVINELPSREESSQEIDNIKQSLQKLEEERYKTENDAELRKKQFSLLFYALDMLKSEREYEIEQNTKK